MICLAILILSLLLFIQSLYSLSKLQIFSFTCFTYFEAIIGYRTTPRSGYESKKAHNCRVGEFRAVLYVKVNGRVGAIPT